MNEATTQFCWERFDRKKTPTPEPIRLQNLGNSAASKLRKKKNVRLHHLMKIPQ